MRSSRNKILIILLAVIAILAIGGGVFAYVYFCTDTLRSGQELFTKYLKQNFEELSQTISFKELEEVEAKLKENKYEETITISYTDTGNSTPSGVATIDTQNDPTNSKIAGIVSLATQNPEEALAVKFIKENDTYSVKFNGILQFLSFKNSNLKEFAKKLGADEAIIEEIPDKIDFEENPLEDKKFTEEEKNAEIKKYLELIYNSIAKENYTKSKDVVITVNGKTITTNAYILTLNTTEVKNITLKLLETLKTDEIILNKIQALDETIQEYSEGEESLKDTFVESVQSLIDELTAKKITEEKNIIITVYEENGKTVRIKMEQELDNIILDTTEVEGKKQVKLNYTSIDEENTQLSAGITFIKESNNKLSVEFNIVDGEEQLTSGIDVEVVKSEADAKLDIVIKNDDGKTLISRNINFVDEIDYNVILDNENNIIINEKPAEQLSSIFNIVGEQLQKEYVEKINPEHLAPFTMLIKPITDIFSVDEDPLDAINDTEKELFNNKFTLYEGSDISTEDINALLNVVFTHNQEQKQAESENYVIVSGDVMLDEDATSITKVEGTKSYTVECKYEEGVVNEIIITENSEEITLE